MNSNDNDPQRSRSATGAERTKKCRMKNPDKVKLSNLKNRVKMAGKRLSDELYDSSFRESAKKRQRKSREKKRGLLAENQSSQNLFSPEPGTSRSKTGMSTAGTSQQPKNQVGPGNICQLSRQNIAGKKIRKKFLKEKNKTIDDLNEEKAKLLEQVNRNEDEIFSLQLQVSELQQVSQTKDRRIENLQAEMKESDKWFGLTYKKLSSNGRKEFRVAVDLAQSDFPRGTLRRLRESTGLNFSKAPCPEKNIKTDLKVAIEKFAVENSCVVPDMRKEKKNIRYCFNYLICLHANFLVENPNISVSYAVFCSYWPKNIIKPRIEDYGSCKCETCENIELKLCALQKRDLINRSHDIQSIIIDGREGSGQLELDLLADLALLKDGPKSAVSVSFLQWEKVEKRNVNNNIGDKKKIMNRVPKVLEAKYLSELTEADFVTAKKHLNRSIEIKNFIKEKRLEISNSSTMAMLQVDWAENGEVIVPGEVQSAFYGGRLNYSLHTGYQYTQTNSGGFVSLSDFSNHKAEAIYAALDSKIKQLVDEGKSEIIIVSDSPTSQYRNAKMVFLTKSWAEQFGIRIQWIYTEAGHGKSAADGIGGKIKNLVKDKVAFNRQYTISTMQDIIELIRRDTTIELKIHTKEEVLRVANSLPHLSSLKGALKIHEILYEDGKVLSKQLPGDAFYSLVIIRESRNMSHVTTTENETNSDVEE